MLLRWLQIWFLPDKIIVESDESVAVLRMGITGLALGAGLYSAVVVGDAGPVAVDIVVLHAHHVVLLVPCH